MKSLSLIGMCKNAGKTTVLNAILEHYFHREIILGLTSIGRDGEDLDIVTSTHKPRIYVKEGTIFATASALLPECDTTKEILMTTGINTPLGEVIILRALTGGYVQLAGPSINTQIPGLCEALHKFGAEFIIVDGAFSRKTLASPAITDYTILCSGASLGKNLRSVVRETRHVHDLLKTTCAKPEILELISGYTLALIDENNACQNFEQAALTDTLVDFLIRQGHKNFKIIAEDASKFLINSDSMKKLSLRGAELLVRKAINLIAVTVNPISAYGYSFDAEEFSQALMEGITTPVLNVKQEGVAFYELLDCAAEK